MFLPVHHCCAGLACAGAALRERLSKETRNPTDNVKISCGGRRNIQCANTCPDGRTAAYAGPQQLHGVPHVPDAQEKYRYTKC